MHTFCFPGKKAETLRTFTLKINNNHLETMLQQDVTTRTKF